MGTANTIERQSTVAAEVEENIVENEAPSKVPEAVEE